MENGEIKYISKSTNFKIGFICVFVLLFISEVLLAELLRMFWSECPPLISFIIFISPIVLLYIFGKQIKEQFTRNILFEFDEQSFTILLSSLKSDRLIKKYDFNWSDIESYQVYFTSNDITVFTFNLRTGGSTTWEILDKKYTEDPLNGDSLFRTIYVYIKQYNQDKNKENQIALNPGFLTTKYGTLLIGAEIILISIVLIAALIIKPQAAILTSTVGVGLVLQQIVKRKELNKLYKRICEIQ